MPAYIVVGTDYDLLLPLACMGLKTKQGRRQKYKHMEGFVGVSMSTLGVSAWSKWSNNGVPCSAAVSLSCCTYRKFGLGFVRT